MAYESVISDDAYPTVLTDENLMSIRANEVLRLADGDAPFHDLWESHVKSLSPKEKEAIHDFLIKEAYRFAKLRDNPEDLIQRIKDDGSGVRSLEDDVNWYDGHIARFKNGAEYLRKLPDFPKNNYRAK